MTMHAVHRLRPVESDDIRRWLGAALKQIRKDAGVTQMQISKAMPPRAGRDTYQSTVHRWEAGENWPTIEPYVTTCRTTQRAILELALRLWREHDEQDGVRPFSTSAQRAGQPPVGRGESLPPARPAEDASGEAP